MVSPSVFQSQSQSEFLATWKRFRAELRRSVLPLAKATQSGLACDNGGNWEWMSPRPLEAVMEIIEVASHEGQLARVAICLRPGCESLRKPFEVVVDTALRLVELQKNEESALQELGESWQCLEAVYQTSSNMRSSESTTDLLRHILHRATAFDDSLRAVLWLDENGRLEPVSALRCELPPSRKLGEGLVGKSIAEERGIILTYRAAIRAVVDRGAEFADAETLLIAPFRTRQGLSGALAIWQEVGQSELNSRTMHLIQTLALQAGGAIENDRLQRARLADERLRQEVEIASRIQHVLLVAPTPQDVPGLNIAALSVPSGEVDGDFYDFFRRGEHVMDLVVGDVMGKGVPAALLGAATKNQLLRSINELLEPGKAFPPPIGKIMELTQREAAETLFGVDHFVTLCYARLDSQKNCMEFIDCGHTRLVHRIARTGRIDLLQGTNTPLGFTLKEEYKPKEVCFEDNDLFFFYSDGLTEVSNVSRELFGEERLVELVRQNGWMRPAELIHRIRQALVAFASSPTFRDDLTCIAVRIEKRRPARCSFTSSLSDLPRIRAFLVRVLEEVPLMSLGESRRSELETAVTEAASNIMKYAYENRKEGPVFLEVELLADRVVVQLRHLGIPFVFPNIVGSPPDGLQESGMGVYIIQQFTDYASSLAETPEGYGVCLAKKLNDHSVGGFCHARTP